MRRVTVVVFVAVLASVWSGAAAWGRPAERVRTRTTPVVLHPRFHEVARGVLSVASDGRYVLVASRASGTFLIDDQTGRRTPLKPPPLCGYTYFVGGGRVLTDCAGYGKPPYQLYSIASGVWTAVKSSGGMPIAVGRDWIEYFGPTESGCFEHCFYQYSFGNIASGQLQTLPEWIPGGTTIPNLNSPGLADQLCSPLRVPQGFPQDFTGSAFAPDLVTFAGRFAAGAEWYMQRGLWQLHLLLERCGSRLHRVITAKISTPDGIPQFAINHHAVVWLSPEGGPVHGLFLPSLQKFTIAFRYTSSAGDLVFLTPRTVYLDTGEGLMIAAASPHPRTHRRRHLG